MRRNAFAGVALVFLFLLWGDLAPDASGQSQSLRPAPAASADGRQPAAPPAAPGPGGFRGLATLYTNNCAGCHGDTDGTAGRAPNLFNQRWLGTITDAQIEQTIRHGVPDSEMGGFTAAQLSDRQVFELISFIRNQTGRVAPPPPFVADPDGKVITSEKQKFKVEVIAKGLETPWGMVFLPDGRMLITERSGHIRVLDKGQLSEPVKDTPTPWVRQDAGFLDITIHPQFSKNGWIYLAYAQTLPGYTPPAPAAKTDGPSQEGEQRAFGFDQGPRIPSNTIIVRGKLTADNRWTEQQVIYQSEPDWFATANDHYGIRFLWDKDGHLFFTLGERGNMKNAQTLANPLGKVHRINDDGSAPKDNPFAKTPGAFPSIWSYGHRNPQGLAWDPVNGTLWESEHGPVGGDEVNVIKPGHNYGWGVVSRGIQPGITERSHEGMDDPVAYYTPAIAPSAIAFYTGDRYPGWKNTSLFVCALKGQQLRRLEIQGDRVVHQEVVFSEFGRVRDIVQGPDGYFYVALQNPTGVNGLPLSASTPGLIIKLVPVQ